jgi:urease beta subunit
MFREPRPSTSLCLAATVLLLAHSQTASAQLLPADRATAWNPGVPGGVPARTTVCATVNASTFGNGSSDASAGIQTAINGCAVGQVVQLSAGTFRINNSPLLISKGITLRGAGPGVTFLKRTNGAVEGSCSASVSDPVVILGPQRWPSASDSTSTNLTVDGAKAATSVTVASGSGLAAGQFVLLDEDDYNTATWTSLPNRNGVPTSVKVWATDRSVWARSNPTDSHDDPFPSSADWFMRFGRPIAEIKEVASVSGNVVTFTTPLHISYRVSHTAQLTRYTGSSVHVKNAGLEDLTVQGGGDGNVRFEAAAYSWMKNVENTSWLGEGVAVDNSFRVEVRDSHVFHTVCPTPGGGGYALSLADGSSEVLIENNIVMDANKVMVARSCGAGSVVGYNYMDDGFIQGTEDWNEVGINGSHEVGSHHMLFEGNEAFNYDSDNTHGNAIYHTVFRNHLSGIRRDFPGLDGARAAGLMFGSWWHSFIGNVLGTQGETSGWIYEDSYPWSGPSMWKLGYNPQHWEQAEDPKVVSTVLRQGNFDYVTNQVHWDTTAQTIPASLYLKAKPAFFGSLPWPWVDPTGTTKLFTLPAKARFEGGGQPAVSVNDVSVSEGNSGTKTAQFTVSLSAGSSNTVTVSYATANGTAQAGTDYVAASGTVSFSPGSVQRTVSVTVNGDTAVEPNETFFLNLSNPSGATLGDAQGVATIVNDDATALPSLRIGDVSVTEGNSGTVNATFTVTLSAASAQTVGVSFATADGTATAASGDYVSQTGSLSFAPGQTTKTIAVAVRGDTAIEGNETFFVNLTSPTNATLADAQGQGTIANDDGTATGGVTWTKAVGVSVSGSSLTKTAATGWGNAGASSVKQLVSGDGYVEFKASETTTSRMAGLSNGDTNQAYGDIDFAVFLKIGGILQLYEKGAFLGSFGTYAAGDVFRVAVTAGIVKYSKNGTVVYTSKLKPVLPLLVDSSLGDKGATITNAVTSGNWQ